MRFNRLFRTFKLCRGSRFLQGTCKLSFLSSSADWFKCNHDFGLIKKLVEDAFACWDTTVWEEGTECDNTVKRGACYTVFPRCSQAGINKPEPKKICRSFCENERRVCRTLKSAFGPNEYIRDICSVDPWVDADGPSETCTGAGSNVYVSSVRWLAACICIVHALFLAMLSN